jgi:hypothetical protein
LPAALIIALASGAAAAQNATPAQPRPQGPAQAAKALTPPEAKGKPARAEGKPKRAKIFGPAKKGKKG